MLESGLSVLVGKKLLITGAAGRLGSSIARAALESGATVVISDVAEDRLYAFGQTLSKQHRGRFFSIPADITNQEGIAFLIQQSAHLVGALTSAVHSAYPRSAGWGTPFEFLNPAYLHQDLASQLGSAILFSQQILRHFELNSGGDLVHISSIQGVRAPRFDHYQGTSMTSPIEYTAIKAGVIAMTGWLAKYYANKRIRINCVSPGGILDSQPKSFTQRYRQSCANIGMLSSDQVASAVIFLLSPAAEAINGQNIIIDDGWSL
jgi:NAD(P)-dependent dehydrogenase (short-subunit alcohol dehydrogenase family)